MRLGMGLGLGNLLSGQPLTGFPNDFSFNFDGSNDYLEIADNSGLQLTTLTISGWINFSSSESGYIITKFDASTTGGYAVEISSGNTLRFYVAGLSARSSNAVFTADEWQHFAVTIDGSGNLAFYRNGVACGTNTITMTTNNVPLLIGNRTGGTNASHFFSGLIDEVAIWDTALSASDVAKIASKPVDFSKASTYATDRTSNLKLWLRAGDKAEPESTTAIARQDFYTDFDGSNDVVTTPSIDLGTTHSVSCWVKTSTGSRVVVGIDGTNYPIYLNSALQINYDATGTPVSSADAIVSGAWNHVVVTRSGTTVNYYINGKVDSGGADTINANDPLNGVFGLGGISSFYLLGQLSNVAFYKTQLDAQTISQFAKSRFTPMRDNRFSVVDFDGTNDYIDCGSDESLDNIWAGGGTLTAWIYPRSDGEGDFGMIAVKRNGNTSGWYLATNDESGGVCDIRLRSARDTADGGWATTSREITLNQWNHIAISYDSDSDSNNPLIYVNGISVGVTENDTPSGSHSSDASDVFKIGGDAGDFTYDGSISSLAVYNTAKSAEEIYAIYQKGITYNESSESGLVGYWRMGDDTSKAYPTIADSSSNSNDGTITNSASDNIVQQMVAGYDMGAFESSSQELGAELSNKDFTGWTLDGSSNWSASSATSLSHTASSAGFASSPFSTISGKIYKVSITINSGQTNEYKLQLGASSWLFDPTDGNDTWSGNHIFYVSNAGNSSNGFKIYAPSNFVGTFTDVSVKEVLQSEVSDTHPAIIDVNEPVLGAELLTSYDFTDTSQWNQVSNVTRTSATSITATANNGTIRTLTSSFESTTKLYKINIQGSITTGSITLKTWGGQETYKTGITGTFNENVYAFTSFGGLQILLTTNTAVATITSLSIKEVFGNAGQMTNQDSADLVYSSVLPDQSFLTGLNSAYNFIDLDGTNEYIDAGTGIGNFLGDNYAGDLSVSMWFKADETNVTKGLLSISSFSDSFGDLFIRLASNELQFKLNNAWTIAHSFTDTSSWNLLTVVYKSGSESDTKLYINNSSVGSSSGTFPSASDLDFNGLKTVIGGFFSSSYVFNGKIGQVAIWNKELSSTEVSAIYTAGRHSNLLDSYSDNLLGYWTMGALDAKTGLSDVGDGTIFDRSGNSNHGTATNTESTDLKTSPNAEPNGYAKGDTNRSTTTP